MFTDLFPLKFTTPPAAAGSLTPDNTCIGCYIRQVVDFNLHCQDCSAHLQKTRPDLIERVFWTNDSANFPTTRSGPAKIGGKPGQFIPIPRNLPDIPEENQLDFEPEMFGIDRRGRARIKVADIIQARCNDRYFTRIQELVDGLSGYILIVSATERSYFNDQHQLHRSHDKPAVLDGETQEWWVNGQRHRENDRPAVVIEGSTKEWWWKGQLHRENDQPAVQDVNYSEWHWHGQQHRVNGPAVVRYESNQCHLAWWLDGKFQRSTIQACPT